MHLPDLQPLLTQIGKITANRVPPGAEKEKADLGYVIRIPVRFRSSADKKDTTLRRYIRSWLLTEMKGQEDIRISTKFLRLPPPGLTWVPDTGGDPLPIHYMIEVHLDEVREGDLDKWKREREKHRARQMKGFLEERLTQEETVKEGGDFS